MVHERQYIFLRLNLVIDMALSAIAIVAAYFTRSVIAILYIKLQSFLPLNFPEILPYEESHLFFEYLWLFPFCIILWPMALNRWGYYDIYDFKKAGSRFWIVVKASLMSVVFLIFVIFVFKQQFIARIVVVGIGFWAVILLFLKDLIIRKVFVRLHNTPEYQHNVLLVYQKSKDSSAKSLIEHYRDWGVRITGEMNIDEFDFSKDSFSDLLTNSQIDEVVFSVKPEKYSSLSALINICEQLGLKTRILINFYSPDILKLSTDYLHGVPLLTLNPTTQNFGALTVKLFFDRITAAILLVVLSPLLLIITIFIGLTSKGPILIKQKRAGLNGKLFTMFKFRSMIDKADQLKENLEGKNELSGWAFKIKDDPRITPVGKILRRFSLDELPQLWNVFTGSMSLVGPRPALPDEIAKLKLWERRRLSMKPGITGLWQVNGRTNLPNEEWIAFDLKYIDSWSVKLDAKIILKTLWVVVLGEGE